MLLYLIAFTAGLGVGIWIGAEIVFAPLVDERESESAVTDDYPES